MIEKKKKFELNDGALADDEVTNLSYDSRKKILKMKVNHIVDYKKEKKGVYKEKTEPFVITFKGVEKVENFEEIDKESYANIFSLSKNEENGKLIFKIEIDYRNPPGSGFKLLKIICKKAEIEEE